jgi:hypothetical protein
MTPKEAIEQIELAIAEVEWEYSMSYAAAFDMAIEALEKQIPKKKELDYESGMNMCPNCSQPFFYDEAPKYCYNCGQAIDFRESEEE